MCPGTRAFSLVHWEKTCRCHHVIVLWGWFHMSPRQVCAETSNPESTCLKLHISNSLHILSNSTAPVVLLCLQAFTNKDSRRLDRGSTLLCRVLSKWLFHKPSANVLLVIQFRPSLTEQSCSGGKSESEQSRSPVSSSDRCHKDPAPVLHLFTRFTRGLSGHVYKPTWYHQESVC